MSAKPTRPTLLIGLPYWMPAESMKTIKSELDDEFPDYDVVIVCGMTHAVVVP